MSEVFLNIDMDVFFHKAADTYSEHFDPAPISEVWVSFTSKIAGTSTPLADRSDFPKPAVSSQNMGHPQMVSVD